MLLIIVVYLETGELQINYEKTNYFAASISPSLGFSSFCFIASTFSVISVFSCLVDTFTGINAMIFITSHNLSHSSKVFLKKSFFVMVLTINNDFTSSKSEILLLIKFKA